MSSLLQDFEAATVDPECFDHEAHVKVAWLLLRDCPLPQAIVRYCGALRRLTAKLGVPGKYHETMTWFFMIMIAERKGARPNADWERFKADNPDLLAGAGKLIGRYYSDERIRSDEAKQVFMLPDRLKVPEPVNIS